MTKDEALKMAIELLEKDLLDITIEMKDEVVSKSWSDLRMVKYYDQIIEYTKQTIQDCKEALEQQEIGDAEIKQMLNDIEYYQKRVKALEQPAEPRLVSYALDCSTCTLNIDGEEVYFNREQPAQEPVAWMMVYREPEHGAAYLTFDKPTREQKISHHPYELYTHPHQWQELTDDEALKVYSNAVSKVIEAGAPYTDKTVALATARAIEQALKEKNT